MRRSTCLLLGAVVAVSPVAGCGDDEDPQPQDSVTAQEAAMVSRSLVLGLETGYSGAPALLEAASQAPGLPGGAAGGIECPAVTVEDGASFLDVTLDYGPPPGCMSVLDGREHSGSLRIRKPQNQSSLSFLFTNYVTGDHAISGSVTGSIAPGILTVVLTDLFLSGPEGITAVDGTFTGSWDNNETPGNLTDDSWEIHITDEAVITATDQKVYFVSVSHTDPLIFMAGCPWPVAGTIHITVQLTGSDDTSAATTVDFGDGACDSFAQVTIGNVTRTLNLITGQTD
jgi:hypothetical protein